MPQKPIPHLDDGTAVLYFDYETADFATKGMTGAANQEQHGKLRDFFGEGYVVTDIKGWTSPEGKRELPSGTTAGRFPGNDPLSKQRADKARDVAVGYCQMRTSQCATEATPATGMGEKLGLEADVGGTRLEQAVVQQFTSDAAELDRLPADERAFITDQRQSVHARAARIYPWLRRAEIKLLHSWSEPVPDKPVPKTGFERIEACPGGGRERGRRALGQPDPLHDARAVDLQAALARVGHAHELVEALEVGLEREAALLAVLLRDRADEVAHLDLGVLVGGLERGGQRAVADRAAGQLELGGEEVEVDVRRRPAPRRGSTRPPDPLGGRPPRGTGSRPRSRAGG